MKRIFVFLLFITILTACSSKGEPITSIPPQIEEKLEATSTIPPTNTPLPTRTPSPTATPKPTIQPTEAEDIDNLREILNQKISDVLILHPSVRAVNTVRWNGNNWEIELAFKYSSPDIIFSSHYEIVQSMSILFVNDPGSDLDKIITPDTVMILTTISSTGDKKYISTNTYDIMVALDKKSITMDEWKAAANYTIK